MKDIVIIGAGGVGRETSMLIDAINSEKKQWNLIGFIDDNDNLWGRIICGHKVLGNVESLNSYESKTYAVCTVSDPKIKKSIIERIKNEKIEYANLIAPTVIMSKDLQIGRGVIIQANCTITTGVKIGNHVQINPQCGIGHDSIIQDYASLYWNVNISGNVNINEGCTIGTKATIIQGIAIGEGSILGSASNVIRDIPPKCTAVGNPAKVIKYHEN